MSEVISGFTVIWVIIAVGYFVGKTGVLGEHAQPVLSRAAFFVASPALLFTVLSESDVGAVLGPKLWIALISGFAVLCLYILAARYLLPARKNSERMLGAMSASMPNSANLGLPIAMYVLGGAEHAAPLILFQLAIYTPVYVMALDTLTMRENPKFRNLTRGFWHSLSTIAFTVVRNPLIIGSIVGLLFSVFGWKLWDPLHEAINHIGSLSIPAMLMAFGLSLVGSKPLDKTSGRRREVVVASVFKLLLHPIIAWVLAAFVFQLPSDQVFASVVLASLPTAQNVFVAANRYETGLTVSRDTVLVTTIVAIPAMMIVAWLLA